MKHNERKLLNTLLNNAERRSANEMVEYLWQNGLINRVAVEQLYINTEVLRRVRNGETKCRAIEQLSVEMGCSYEKARAAVYRKHK